MKYRKKPIVVDAIEWTGDNLLLITRFTGQIVPNTETHWDDYVDLINREGLKIYTLEGSHMANIGDMIIKGVQGEFYPCKPNIFAKTYEAIE